MRMQDAEELCRKVLKLSDSILESSILDESGTVLSRLSRNPAGQRYEPTKDALQKYGTWVKLMFSMAQETDRIFGTTQYAAIAHSRFKHLAVPIAQGRAYVAMVVDRAADNERIVSTVQATMSKQKDRLTTSAPSNIVEHGRKIPTA